MLKSVLALKTLTIEIKLQLLRFLYKQEFKETKSHCFNVIIAATTTMRKCAKTFQI